MGCQCWSEASPSETLVIRDIAIIQIFTALESLHEKIHPSQTVAFPDGNGNVQA